MILRIWYMAKISLGTSTPKKYLESCFCSVLDGHYCSSSADVVLARTHNLHLHGERVAKARAINSRTPLQLYIQFAIGQRWICARTSAFCDGNGWICSLCHRYAAWCWYDGDQKVFFSMRATLRHLLFYFIFHEERNLSIKISIETGMMFHRIS